MDYEMLTSNQQQAHACYSPYFSVIQGTYPSYLQKYNHIYIQIYTKYTMAKEKSQHCSYF